MEEIIITKYVSVWGWQLMAMMFLCSSFIFFALPRTLITQSFYVAFFLIFIICEFKTLERKKEIYNDILPAP